MVERHRLDVSPWCAPASSCWMSKVSTVWRLAHRRSAQRSCANVLLPFQQQAGLGCRNGDPDWLNPLSGLTAGRGWQRSVRLPRKAFARHIRPRDGAGRADLRLDYFGQQASTGIRDARPLAIPDERPARTVGDAYKQDEELDRRRRGDAEFPTPAVAACNRADGRVAQIRDQDAGHDGELEDPNKLSSLCRRGDLGNERPGTNTNR